MDKNVTAKFTSILGTMYPADFLEFCLDSRGTDPSRGSFTVTSDELETAIGNIADYVPTNWGVLRETAWTLEMTDQNGAVDTVTPLYIDMIEPLNDAVTSDETLAARSVTTFRVIFADRRKWLKYGDVSVRANVTLTADDSDDSSGVDDDYSAAAGFAADRSYTWQDLFEIVNRGMDAEGVGAIEDLTNSLVLFELSRADLVAPRDVIWEHVSFKTALDYILEAKNIELVLLPSGIYRLYIHYIAHSDWETFPEKTELGKVGAKVLDLRIERPERVKLYFPQYVKETFVYNSGGSEDDWTIEPLLADITGKLRPEAEVVAEWGYTMEQILKAACLDSPFQSIAGGDNPNAKIVESLMKHCRRTFRIKDKSKREILPHKLIWQNGEYVALDVKADYYRTSIDPWYTPIFNNWYGYVPAKVTVADKVTGIIHINHPNPLGLLHNALYILEEGYIGSVYVVIDLWYRKKAVSEYGYVTYDDYALELPTDEPDLYGEGVEAIYIPDIPVNEDETIESYSRSLAAEVAKTAERQIYGTPASFEDDIDAKEEEYFGSTGLTAKNDRDMVIVTAWRWTVNTNAGYTSLVRWGSDKSANEFRELTKAKGKRVVEREGLKIGYAGDKPTERNSSYLIEPLKDALDRVNLICRATGKIALIDIAEGATDESQVFVTLTGRHADGHKLVTNEGALLHAEHDSTWDGYILKDSIPAVVTAVNGSAAAWNVTCRRCDHEGNQLDAVDITAYDTHGRGDIGVGSRQKPVVGQIVYIIKTRTTGGTDKWASPMFQGLVPVKYQSGGASGMSNTQFLNEADNPYVVKLVDKDGNVYGDAIAECYWYWGRYAYYHAKIWNDTMNSIWGVAHLSSARGQANAFMENVRLFFNQLCACLDCTGSYDCTQTPCGLLNWCNCMLAGPCTIDPIIPTLELDFDGLTADDRIWLIRDVAGNNLLYADKYILQAST